MTTPEAEPPDAADSHSDQPSKRPSTQRFRFKSKRRRLDINEDREALLRGLSSAVPAEFSPGPSRSPSPTTHRRSRRTHRRHKKHKPRASPSPPPAADDAPAAPLDPDAAFRETLFDALADEDAADFWSDVYGQPIHIYPRPHDDKNGGGDGEEGTSIHRMTDDEYAAYVRARMWERTEEAVEEERGRRARERARQRRKREEEEEEKGRAEREKEEFGRAMEESLRRGARRREERAWAEAWGRYVRGWEGLMAAVGKGEYEGGIPWPVRSGKVEDVGREEVEGFFRKAAEGKGTDEKEMLRALLKAERVRWHPDKMMQRFGGGEKNASRLDGKTMQAITAVFQMVDAMWAEVSKSA